MDINFVKFCEYKLQNPQHFWKGIKLLVLKPHIVNKRYAGAVQLLHSSFTSSDTNSTEKLIGSIPALSTVEPEPFPINKALMNFGIQSKEIPLMEFSNNMDEIGSIHGVRDIDIDIDGFIVVNRILPKNLKAYTARYELVVIDLRLHLVLFINLGMSTDALPYCIKLNRTDDLMSVNYFHVEHLTSRHSTWLGNKVTKKLVKWIETFDEYSNNNHLTSAVPSLSLIEFEQYNKLYNELKDRYGKQLVENWTEQTDPTKFVYEDIGIAAYLICLWRQERITLNTIKLQSFVDLGCGNGLLVYILNSEGHPGFGIDLRKRKIWDKYPETTILKVETIRPSNTFLYPDIDWIIGNHSDELSPWVPVIAAKSSYTARYFLLPCCAYEFNGRKFQRRRSTKSQYNDFLDYAKEVSDTCGFETWIDRLRIPSTKRVCLIGQNRIYKQSEFDQHLINIDKFIDRQSKNERFENETKNEWSKTFKVRDLTEKIQNCTKVDKEIQDQIVQFVLDQLLIKKNFVDEFPNWNVGGTVSLNQLAQRIQGDRLKYLKSECGGLQTLLRNRHQLFVVKQGTVQLRLPEKYDPCKMDKPGFVFKQKECWFHYHHPDMCPFSDDDCSFKH